MSASPPPVSFGVTLDDIATEAGKLGPLATAPPPAAPAEWAGGYWSGSGGGNGAARYADYGWEGGGQQGQAAFAPGHGWYYPQAGDGQGQRAQFGYGEYGYAPPGAPDAGAGAQGAGASAGQQASAGYPYYPPAGYQAAGQDAAQGFTQGQGYAAAGTGYPAGAQFQGQAFSAGYPAGPGFPGGSAFGFPQNPYPASAGQGYPTDPATGLPGYPVPLPAGDGYSQTPPTGAASPSRSDYDSDERAPSTVGADGRKQYPCPHPGCGKAYGSRGHLNRHRRVHQTESWYTCPIPGCGKRFARIDNMKTHHTAHAKRIAEGAAEDGGEPVYRPLLRGRSGRRKINE